VGDGRNKELAAQLGIEIKDKKLYYEKRYLILVEQVKDDKKFAYSNNKPIPDIKEAKSIALAKVNNIEKDDLITFRAIELEFAEVPINTLLGGKQTDIQPISSRYLLPKELKELLL